MLHLALHWIQLFVFVLNPGFAWGPVMVSVAEKYIKKGQLQHLVAFYGYDYYFFAFIALGSMVIFTIAVFAFVKRDFEKHQGAQGWFAVFYIRNIVKPLFYTFYLSGLGMFLLCLDCIYSDRSVPVNKNFNPPVTCWGYPHAYLSASAIIGICVFVCISFGCYLVQFEWNPNAKVPLALAPGDMHIRAFLFQTIMALASFYLSTFYPFYAAIIVLYMSYKMFIDSMKLQQYHREWVNMINCSLHSLHCWCALVQMIVVIRGDGRDDVLSIVLLAGIAPAIAYGIGRMMVRQNRLNGLKLVEESEGEGNGVHVVVSAANRFIGILNFKSHLEGPIDYSVLSS